MTLIYNMTPYDNVTHILDFAVEMNTQTDGWVVGMLLLSIWVITLLVFSKKEGILELIIGASFAVCVVGGLLAVNGFVPPTYLLPPFVALILGLFSKIIQ